HGDRFAPSMIAQNPRWRHPSGSQARSRAPKTFSRSCRSLLNSEKGAPGRRPICLIPYSLIADARFCCPALRLVATFGNDNWRFVSFLISFFFSFFMFFVLFLFD